MPAPGIEQLRDIHPPPQLVAWQAYSEWLPLAVLAGLVAGGFAWWLARRFRRRLAGGGRRQALRQLRGAQARYAGDGDAVRLARDLDALLRREAIRRYPEQNISRLTGAAWLAFLDRTGDTNAFQSGPGHCLATLPYQRGAPLASADLASVVGRWLAH